MYASEWLNPIFPVSVESACVQSVIWKTWCQESVWHNRKPGTFNRTTTNKLAAKYTLQNAEEFVRAQFLMGVLHTYEEAYHFRFTHLINAKCDEAYQEWRKSCDTIVKHRVFCIESYYKRWLAYRHSLTDNPEEPPPHIDCTFTKLLIYETQKRDNVPVFPDYSAKALDRLYSLAAVECIRYPWLLEAEVIQRFPEMFQRICAMIEVFKVEIYGRSWSARA